MEESTFVRSTPTLGQSSVHSSSYLEMTTHLGEDRKRLGTDQRQRPTLKADRRKGSTWESESR